MRNCPSGSLREGHVPLMSTTSWEKLFRNIFSQYVSTALSVLTGFVLIPLVIRSIGLVEFGLWALVTGLVGTMSLLDAGLAPTLTKKSAELLALNDQAELNRTANRILTLYLLIGVLSCAIMCLLAFFVGKIFHIPAGELYVFRVVLIIVALQLAITFPLSTWGGIVSGLQDFHILSAISVVTTLAKFVLTITLLKLGFGLVSLVWLGFFAACAGGVTSLVWVRYRLPGLKIRTSPRYLTELGDVVRFSGIMFIWGIAGRILLESDRIIIGIFLPVAAISIYEVGLRICNYSRSILYPMFTLLPAASDLSALNQKARLQQLYIVGTKYFVLAYAFVASALLLFGKQFVLLWVGPGFEGSVTIMVVLLLGNLYQSQNLVAHVLLPGMGRLRVFTWIMVAYPIINLALSILLVRKWGLLGVALGTATTYFLAETVFLFFIISIFEVRISRLLLTCHVPVLTIILPAAAISYYFKLTLNSQSWSGLIAGIGVFSFCFAAALLTYGLSGPERDKIRSVAAKLILRPA
jgi:O-antigen/teichoic acid export membrane protein